MSDAEHRRYQEGVRQQSEQDEGKKSIRIVGNSGERICQVSALLVPRS